MLQNLVSRVLSDLGLISDSSPTSKSRAGSRSSLLPSNSTPPSPTRKQQQQQQQIGPSNSGGSRLLFTRKWTSTFYYTISIAIWYLLLSWLEFLPPPTSLLSFGRAVEAQKIAWASQERSGVNTTLPSPYDGYRWTFLHANVMELENGTRRRLEMLTYLEEVPPKRQPGWWQLTVPDIPKIIDHTTSLVEVNGQIRATLCSMEYQFPRAPFDNTKANWALLIACDIPSALQLPTTARGGRMRRSLPKSVNFDLDLTLANKRTVFSQHITLQPYRIAEVQKGSLGVCVAPMYGPLDDARVLEWRVHHALLGVKAVHWYDRTGHNSTRKWVGELSKQMNLEDTWTEAPCISPETCGTDILEAKGVSGDQVLYYADCLARSRHTHPTEWLAMIDVDEFILPGKNQNTSVITETLAQLDPTVAMLALDRFQTPATVSGGATSQTDPAATASHPLIIEGMKTLLTPQEIDRHDNGKILYRSSALKLAWIHWEVAFREDQPAQHKLKYDTLDGQHPFGLVHVSDSRGTKPFKLRVDTKEVLGEHIDAVRKAIHKIQAKFPWLVS